MTQASFRTVIRGRVFRARWQWSEHLSETEGKGGRGPPDKSFPRRESGMNAAMGTRCLWAGLAPGPVTSGPEWFGPRAGPKLSRGVAAPHQPERDFG
jgi:hypothetical protein